MSKIKYGVLLACFFVGCSSVETPRPSTIEVKCSECDGKGKVIYGPDHPITKMGFKQGTYNCPMCDGSGKLYNEP